MKKLLIILLCVYMSITVFASPISTYKFEYDTQGITILFDENTLLLDDKRQYIADYLVYGTLDDSVSTYAWCWLTGHDLVTDSVIEIQHKIADDIPRCLKTTYEVITCTKCDHVETNVLSSVFIDCCPED